jgi:beta-barrel assembly-enhancing protease
MGVRPAASRPGPARAARALAIGAALALALPGCISETREIALGEQIAAQVNAQLPMVRDPEVNAYLSALGGALAAHSERPHLEYRFHLVDTPMLNAFALPGGYVYVNRGLVERTGNASELAGILAHEIGHVAARHGAQNLQRHLRTRSMAATMYHLILNRGPLLDQEALDLGGALWNASHSRRAEVEADRLAVRYLLRSGMDPRGMLSLFAVLREEERRSGEPGSPVSWFSTHPGTDRRMEATRERIRETLPRHATQTLTVETAAYDAFMERLHALPRPGHLPLLRPPGQATAAPAR